MRLISHSSMFGIGFAFHSTRGQWWSGREDVIGAPVVLNPARRVAGILTIPTQHPKRHLQATRYLMQSCPKEIPNPPFFPNSRRPKMNSSTQRTDLENDPCMDDDFVSYRPMRCRRFTPMPTSSHKAKRQGRWRSGARNRAPKQNGIHLRRMPKPC